MQKYAKIDNTETKVVSVGEGSNGAFYASIGMTMMEVEKSDIDGQWYVAGYAPMKTEEQKRKEAEKTLEKQYAVQVQAILDEAAFALGYTGDNEQVSGACNSVCTYFDTGVEKFDKEGRQFRRWRSAIWNRGYELLGEVKAGTRAVPTPEELPDLLPKLTDFEEVSV